MTTISQYFHIIAQGYFAHKPKITTFLALYPKLQAKRIAMVLSPEFLIVMADDDPDDIQFTEEALKCNNYPGYFKNVNNGQMLMDLLGELHSTARPGLILLDLNMPLKDGFQALAEIKSKSYLCDIPVIVLTSSSRKADEATCYSLGCNKFFQKPFLFSDYNKVAREIMQFLIQL